jgi:pyruvate/2-oxoglutarate dehydrogenase complex dihydrolipoamide acyltransferase (E2) component
MKELRIPEDLWEQDLDGTLVTWLYESGDEIAAGAVVAQLMVEKIQVDLTAPVGGKLHIELPQESIVRKGQRVALLEEHGE